MATQNLPFVRGRDIKLKLFQDGTPIVIDAKNFDLEENATENADGVNGEDRDRLDKVTNYYTGSVDIYQSDQHVMEKIMEAQDQDDAAGIPLTQYATIVFNNRDGTRAAYVLTECKFGPFKNTASGRGETAMLNLRVRGRYWKKAKAA